MGKIKQKSSRMATLHEIATYLLFDVSSHNVHKTFNINLLLNIGSLPKALHKVISFWSNKQGNDVSFHTFLCKFYAFSSIINGFFH
ncbi:hypothetical protein UP17_25725 (plasmid) [Peribacillus simplex]|nr:hypothetical protein UP17_25725 [Peribacillus simplex]